MADMMWAGRFSKQVDAGVNAFNSSIAFDGRMYRHLNDISALDSAVESKFGLKRTSQKSVAALNIKAIVQFAVSFHNITPFQRQRLRRSLKV